MNSSTMEASKTVRFSVLLATLFISAIFLVMIRSFLIALFLAAVFSGLVYPLNEAILARTGGRRTVASALTLALVVLLVVVPILVLAGVVAAQAYQMSEQVVPWIKGQIHQSHESQLTIPEWVPFGDKIDLSSGQIFAKVGEFAGKAGHFLVNSLAAASQGTATFFLNLFVMLYAMFYFLNKGPAVKNSLLDCVPLPHDMKQQLVARAMSVVRATLKGTTVIGIAQGFLGGAAMAVLGIQGAVLWGALMAIMSVVPGIGTAVIWIPAVIYLLAIGSVGPAVALGVWCAVVVGSIDNLLRPRLVGGDAKMPDILILVSTFGGLAAFGAVGLIIGPTIAAIFVTMWHLFGKTFGGEFDAVASDAS